MKRGIWRKLVSTVLVASMVLASAATSALAAEPDSVQEFRQGKTKTAVSSMHGKMVIQQDGSLWAYGQAGEGLLGNNGGYDDSYQSSGKTIAVRTYPEKVLEDVSFVSMNDSATIAVKNDGTLWVTGLPISEYLKNDTRIEYKKQMSFVQLSEHALSGVADHYITVDKNQLVSGSGEVIYIVKTDGSLWRTDFEAQRSTEFDTSAPLESGQEVPSITTTKWNASAEKKIMDGVKDFRVQDLYQVLLDKDGALWLRGGSRDEGYTAENKDSAKKLMTNTQSIAINNNVVTAIKDDNSLWVIDLSSFSNNQTPMKIMDNVKSCNGHHIITNDNQLWEIDPSTHEPKQSVISGVTSLAFSGWDVIKGDGELWGYKKNGWASNAMDGAPDEFIQLTGFSATIPTISAQTATATPIASKVLVNGKEISFDAYEINGNNYFKLRDIANVVSGTGKQFEVTWDSSKNAINLLSNKAYTAVGGELAKGDGSQKPATLNASKVYLDGKEISLTAYTINDNNYFKLRDLGQTFNFGVGWDGAANTVTIDTSTGYTAE